MNRVIISGRLARDPEIRYTATQKAVCSFTVAVQKFGQKDADFFRVEAWEKQAENCGVYLQKGSSVLLEGRLIVEKYEKDGQSREAWKIRADRVEFLSSPARETQPQREEPKEEPPASLFQAINEELPF